MAARRSARHADDETTRESAGDHGRAPFGCWKFAVGAVPAAGLRDVRDDLLVRICGHGGARQVDHLEPVIDYPALAMDLRNCRPAHGAPRNRCPACGQFCNQLKADGTVTRARRIIARRAGEAAAQPRDPPADRDAGRDW